MFTSPDKDRQILIGNFSIRDTLILKGNVPVIRKERTFFTGEARIRKITLIPAEVHIVFKELVPESMGGYVKGSIKVEIEDKLKNKKDISGEIIKARVFYDEDSLGGSELEILSTSSISSDTDILTKNFNVFYGYGEKTLAKVGSFKIMGVGSRVLDKETFLLEGETLEGFARVKVSFALRDPKISDVIRETLAWTNVKVVYQAKDYVIKGFVVKSNVFAAEILMELAEVFLLSYTVKDGILYVRDKVNTLISLGGWEFDTTKNVIEGAEIKERGVGSNAIRISGKIIGGFPEIKKIRDFKDWAINGNEITDIRERIERVESVDWNDPFLFFTLPHVASLTIFNPNSERVKEILKKAPEWFRVFKPDGTKINTYRFFLDRETLHEKWKETLFEWSYQSTLLNLNVPVGKPQNSGLFKSQKIEKAKIKSSPFLVRDCDVITNGIRGSSVYAVSTFFYTYYVFPIRIIPIQKFAVRINDIPENDIDYSKEINAFPPQIFFDTKYPNIFTIYWHQIQKKKDFDSSEFNDAWKYQLWAIPGKIKGHIINPLPFDDNRVAVGVSDIFVEKREMLDIFDDIPDQLYNQGGAFYYNYNKEPLLELLKDYYFLTFTIKGRWVVNKPGSDYFLSVGFWISPLVEKEESSLAASSFLASKNTNRFMATFVDKKSVGKYGLRFAKDISSDFIRDPFVSLDIAKRQIQFDRLISVEADFSTIPNPYIRNGDKVLLKTSAKKYTFMAKRVEHEFSAENQITRISSVRPVQKAISEIAELTMAKGQQKQLAYIREVYEDNTADINIWKSRQNYLKVPYREDLSLEKGDEVVVIAIDDNKSNLFILEKTGGKESDVLIIPEINITIGIPAPILEISVNGDLVELKWSDVSRASVYKVYEVEKLNFFGEPGIVREIAMVTETELRLVAEKIGQFMYAVKAFTLDGEESLYSNVVTVVIGEIVEGILQAFLV